LATIGLRPITTSIPKTFPGGYWPGGGRRDWPEITMLHELVAEHLEEERRAARIDDGMIRVSCGVERVTYSSATSPGH
jgi:hypothetical protein